MLLNALFVIIVIIAAGWHALELIIFAQGFEANLTFGIWRVFVWLFIDFSVTMTERLILTIKLI